MKVVTVTLHPALDQISEVGVFQPSNPTAGNVIREYVAGKGINAARALQRLGVPVIATGFLGRSTFDLLNESLEKEGIVTSFLPCEAPTRKTRVIQESSTGKQHIQLEPRQNVTSDEAKLLIVHVAKILKDVDLCLLCGAGQGESLEELYMQVIQSATAKGIRCLIDSSHTSLRNGVAAKPFGLKVNREELSELFGDELTGREAQVAALKTLVDSGIELAAVSDAVNGLLAVQGNSILHGHVETPVAINTIGCGDAVLAGMAKAILENAPLPEIVRWGIACGAANTQQVGAGFLEALTVQKFLKTANVESCSDLLDNHTSQEHHENI